MSRPNLGYSNYHWIRQDQKAAQKKAVELKTELSSELTPENPHENHDARSSDAAVTNISSSSGGETEVKTQDFCDKHAEISDVHAAKHDVGSKKDDSNHEESLPKRETVQESLTLASIVRDGEGKSDVVPSIQHPPRIDSWLPAVVPESDK